MLRSIMRNISCSKPMSLGNGSTLSRPDEAAGRPDDKGRTITLYGAPTDSNLAR